MLPLLVENDRFCFSRGHTFHFQMYGQKVEVYHYACLIILVWGEKVPRIL